MLSLLAPTWHSEWNTPSSPRPHNTNSVSIGLEKPDQKPCNWFSAFTHEELIFYNTPRGLLLFELCYSYYKIWNDYCFERRRTETHRMDLKFVGCIRAVNVFKTLGIVT